MKDWDKKESKFTHRERCILMKDDYRGDINCLVIEIEIHHYYYQMGSCFIKLTPDVHPRTKS